MRWLAISFIVVMASFGAAHAAPDYSFTVSFDSKLKCDSTPKAPQGPTSTTNLQIELAPGAGLQLTDLTSAGADKGNAGQLIPNAATNVADITIDVSALSASDSITLNVKTSKSSDPVACPSIKAKAAPQSASGDLDAYNWWVSDLGKSALDTFKKAQRDRGLPRSTDLIVLLPSGQFAPPSSNSLREGKHLQIAIIEPTTATSVPSASVTSCAALQTFRMTGTPADKQAGHGPVTATGAVPGDHQLIALGPYFQCGAGALNFTISDGSNSTTNSLTLNPVYSFALVTALGFDTAITHAFKSAPGPSGSGDVIAAVHDRVGESVLIGGAWMLGGVDYTHMRWYNYIANPFVTFDATSPLDGFVVGDSFTVSGGISFGIGLSVHRGTRLVGAQVGDALMTGSQPSTDPSWRDARLGLFVGIVFDSNVFKAITAASSSPSMSSTAPTTPTPPAN